MDEEPVVFFLPQGDDKVYERLEKENNSCIGNICGIYTLDIDTKRKNVKQYFPDPKLNAENDAINKTIDELLDAIDKEINKTLQNEDAKPPIVVAVHWGGIEGPTLIELDKKVAEKVKEKKYRWRITYYSSTEDENELNKFEEDPEPLKNKVIKRAYLTPLIEFSEKIKRILVPLDIEVQGIIELGQGDISKEKEENRYFNNTYIDNIVRSVNKEVKEVSNDITLAKEMEDLTGALDSLGASIDSLKGKTGDELIKQCEDFHEKFCELNKLISRKIKELGGD